VHREARGGNEGFDVVEALLHLVGEARWRAAVGFVRALAGDVNVVAGVDSWRAKGVGFCRNLARRDRFYLSMRTAGRRKGHQSDASDNGEMPPHDFLAFFCASPRSSRRRLPTIISSPS